MKSVCATLSEIQWSSGSCRRRRTQWPKSSYRLSSCWKNTTGERSIDAYITDCVIEPHIEPVEAADGTLHYVEDTTVHDLRFTIDANVQFVGNAYSVGTQELRVGKSHIVKTVGLEVNGTILSMEEVTTNE